MYSAQRGVRGKLQKAIVAVVAALAVCWQSDSNSARAASIADRPTMQVGSKVADMRIVLASRLPGNAKRIAVAEYCSAYAVAHPKTLGGRLAAANGWIVTSETRLGNYDVVTFVGMLEAVTSGTCVHEHGNLAVFNAAQLKAIAFEPAAPADADPNDLATVDSLGSAQQINDRRVRLYWGLPSSPFADVVLRHGISIEPIAKKDSVCRGAALVPNVFGEDIRQARRTLRSYGWLPKKSEEQDTGAEDLIRQGVREVEACSGTGYGFCAFNYGHKNGSRLRVVSAGEEYRVTSYEASCARRRGTVKHT
jgi:hypothetical protein